MKLRFLLALFASLASQAQSGYFGSQATTVSKAVPVGISTPVLTLPYAKVTVCLVSGVNCTAANLYSDPALTTRVGNPFTADATGYFGFYAAPGQYRYTVTGTLGISGANGAFTVTASGGTASLPANLSLVSTDALGVAYQTTSVPLSLLPSIPNSKLVNPSLTINSTVCTLGGTCTIPGGSSVTLQTNGTNNGSQSTLNLVAGSNVTLSNSGGNVTINASGSGSSGVSSFNSRTGAVTPQSGDYSVGQVTGAAPLASPTFTGTVILPANQVVNGVTLQSGGSATSFLNAAGNYTTPAGSSLPTATASGQVPVSNGAGTVYVATASNALAICTGSAIAGTYCDGGTRQWTALPNSSTASVTNQSDPLFYTQGVPIYDGNAHTYSELSSSAPCGGLTTYSALGNCTDPRTGKKPFAFLSDDGTVYGDKCTKGSTNRNCMTDNLPAIGSLNLAWAASQAAILLTHVLNPEPGIMIWDRDFLFPICTQYDMNQCYEINGAGRTASVIRAKQDYGAGHVMISAGDYTATQSNQLGAYQGNAGQAEGMIRNIMLDIPGIQSGQPHNLANGGPTYKMNGINLASRTDLENFWVRGFNNGIVERGDHRVETNVHELLNWNCRRWDDVNYTLYGDIAIHDDTCNAYFAGATVAPSASISASWSGKSYSSGAYWLFGEAGTACANLVSGLHVESMHFEYTNLGLITEANALPGYNGNGTAYHPEKTCRPIKSLDMQVFQLGYNTGNDSALATGFPNLYRNYTIMTSEIDRMELKGLDIGGLNPSPNQGSRFGGVDGSGNSIGAGFIVAPQVGVFLGGIYMNGAMQDFFNAFPYQLYRNNSFNGNNGGYGLNGNFQFEQVGQFKGVVNNMPVQGNYTNPVSGDLVELLSFNNDVLAPAGTSFNQDFYSPLIGVIAQNGLTLPAHVPVITESSAYIAVNLPWETDNHWHTLVFTNTGIRGLNIINGGTGVTNGTYNWTAACSNGGATPAGTITATGGSFTSFTVTNLGSRCSSVPTVSISGTPGGSGYNVVAQWPAGTGRSPSLQNQGLGQGPYVGWGQAGRGNAGQSNFGWLIQVRPGSR